MALSSSAVHGVSLRLEPWWAWAEAARWTVPDNDLRELFEIGGGPTALYRGLEPRDWWPRLDLGVRGASVDLSWRPPWWDATTDGSIQGWRQIEVVIAVRPRMLAEAQELAGQLREEASDALRVALEVRPVPVLFTGGPHERMSCGNRIGTAGGVIGLPDGAPRIVASAHVCPEGQPAVIGSFAAVCDWSETLKLTDRIPNDLDFDDAPRTDLALLDAGSEQEALSGIPIVQGVTQPGQLAHLSRLEMLAPRKTRPLEVDELVVAQCFRVDGLNLGGTWALYRDLFSMRLRTERWTDRALDVGGSVGGDSGAWLVLDGPAGLEWAGSVVGGRAPFTYAAFAHRALEASSATIPYPDDLASQVA